MGGLSPSVVSGGCSLLRCEGFLSQRFLPLWSTGFRRKSFSSCGTWAYLPCGMWNLPGPGIESLSPELAGGFLTTGPPGKPLPSSQIHKLWICDSNPGLLGSKGDSSTGSCKMLCRCVSTACVEVINSSQWG